jgi:FdhE protein
MRDPWERRIRRADQLAEGDGAAAPLLAFYAQLLRRQRAVSDHLRDRPVTGSLQQDVAWLRAPLVAMLREVATGTFGTADGASPRVPEQLRVEAGGLLDQQAAALDDLLLSYWHAPSDRLFFPKAILQPYAERIAQGASNVVDRGLTLAGNRCPFCGGAPQLSVLEPASEVTSADGGGRRLQCSMCLGTWAFSRVLCASCGEEREHALCYFQSPAFDHLRVDACDTCKRYLKAIDLTRLGVAVPLVDEVAGAPLDVWARERGYEKIELNLLGL